MAHELTIAVGQHSDKGRKPVNQDFHGAFIPAEPQRRSKGIAIAIADGISSSDVSHIASESAVKTFLDDYFCTSDAWSVKTSAVRVLTAVNSWLHAQTRQSQYRYERDRGYVCTLSALVLKAATAHLFHVGDARIYRLRGRSLEQLTRDHRVVLGEDQSHLARALGMSERLEIDYHAEDLEPGDVFLLATDGVYEFLDERAMVATLQEHAADLDAAARALVEEAHRRGSTDNLTAQVVRVEALPEADAAGTVQQMAGLPLPPLLEARMEFDGYRIVRELHGSSRSHIYLAVDLETEATVALKLPSIDLRGDPAYLERFLLEEWVARRLNSAHVLKPCAVTRKRNYLYVAMEYIEGRTLRQWMIDHPRPDLEAVRGIVEQIARGLRAFHRLEMLHQDLRPENVMIDATGTVKIIDFGATRVEGVAESVPAGSPGTLLGTAQYSAPEYFLGERGTPRSDLFSLGVITYEMLAGRLPYGAQVARTRTRAAQSKLEYESVLDDEREIPAWIDGALRKAVHIDPFRRYEELSEFVYDLRHPNREFLARSRPPLMERNPLLVWKSIALALLILVLLLAARLAQP
ncbi:MAG: putative serine/threonine protein kinase [Moraxellaceae bacterium]|jgi:serine/threonine protein phosphatase PrpC|nr:putative serine/threonine protein kinase [Moraxellaceae bacterium]